MRIVGGTHRGTALAAVGAGDKGAALRPTSDRVREALFNVLSGGRYGDPLTGAHVLDLFAGTGALGLEALSRGATHATFVDSGRVAQQLIAQNLRRLKREADATVLSCDATRLPPTDGPATLVFLDPPYGRDLGAMALAAAQGAGWIAEGALVVWEEEAPMPPPPGFALGEHRTYGGTHLTILERA